MNVDQLKPNAVIRGPLFSEPVQIAAIIPMRNVPQFLHKAFKTVHFSHKLLPTNLPFQWQREVKGKFQESFGNGGGGVLRPNYGVNPWQEKQQVITSVSWASRVGDARESLLGSHWDLVIGDEAHRMSAASADKKT